MVTTTARAMLARVRLSDADFTAICPACDADLAHGYCTEPGCDHYGRACDLCGELCRADNLAPAADSDPRDRYCAGCRRSDAETAA